MHRKMKDSGVEWIGQIPEDWEIAKLGTLYAHRSEKVSDKDYEPLSVTKQGVVSQLATAAKTNDGDNRKLVKAGDFVINSRSDRRGSCGISPLNGSVSLINIVLKPTQKIHSKYYDWLFNTSMFADEFYKWGHGIVDDLWTTRWTEMKKIIAPKPIYEKQSILAAYLDEKVAHIDNIIDKTKKTIEEYKKYKQSLITEAVTKGLNPDVKMKDSGVEWIGEIPEHWEIAKLKYVFEIVKRISGELGYDVLSITQQGIKIKDIKTNEGQLSSDYSKYQFVNEGDYAMNHMDLLTGWVDLSKYFGVTSPDYRVFRLRGKNQYSKEFYLYLFQICYLNRIFYGMGQGVSNFGRWRLQAEVFNL